MFRSHLIVSGRVPSHLIHFAPVAFVGLRVALANSAFSLRTATHLAVVARSGPASSINHLNWK